MSIKIQRIQSREAGPFARNGGRTRAHIEVPASVGFSDLQNSNVVFRMETVIRTPSGNSKLLPTFIAQPARAAGTSDLTQPVSCMGMQALIKNARVTSDTYGVLNEQRDQNVVSANLDWYNDYSTCQAARGTYDGDMNQNGDPNEASMVNAGPFLRPSRPRLAGVAQTDPSRAVNAELRCPLKHVDRNADGTRQFPNLSVGDLTYRIELEDVKPVMSLGPSFNADCQDVAAQAGASFGTAVNPIRYRWAREPEATHTMQVEQLSLDNLPWYVGMPVKVSYTNGTAKILFTSISKLTLQEGAGGGTLNQANVILIETTHPIPAVDAGGASTLVVLELDQSGNDNGGTATPVAGAVTVEYNIIDMYIELHTIQLAPQQIQAAQAALQSLQIPYLEHRVVKKVLNATQDYAETFSLDPGCAGVAVLTPQNNGLVSGYDKCNSYRFSFDGRDVTNRAIAIGPKKSNADDGTATYGIGRQLHNHMLQKFFGNIGKRLLKFDQPAESYNQSFISDQSQLDTHSFFPLVTPMLPDDVIAQFQCSSSANMATKEIYYVSMYPRTLNFQKGNLVM